MVHETMYSIRCRGGDCTLLRSASFPRRLDLPVEAGGIYHFALDTLDRAG